METKCGKRLNFIRLHASYHVAAGRISVLGGAEAGESLLEHEYPERVA